MIELEIVEDDLSSTGTVELLKIHLAGMHANSPPGHVFALDLSGLKRADVTVWTVRSGNAVTGIGALKLLDGTVGEIKSMRTHPDHLRKGVGAALLDHILLVAKKRGLSRLSLETGTGPAFEPALSLYRSRDFKDGEAFGDYVKSPFNQFLHRSL